MESFHWDEGFLTGIADVDDQHHHLVNIINKFGNLVAHNEGASMDAINMVFKELTDYIYRHFSEEEAFMEASGIDPRHLEPHKEAHRQFINDIIQLHDSIVPGNAKSGEQVMKFLTHWLAYHILGTDKGMSRQISSIKAGMLPAQAFENEQQENEASTEPLLAALHGLFQQVSARNKELSELNRSLEQRVADRTKDLTEAYTKLEYIALTDVLTGLPNRRFALESFAKEWQRSSDRDSPISCMMIDADGFKQINDTYGHDAGDEVLRQLSQMLKDSVRSDDFTARLGGDEFLIICPGTDLKGALLVAEQIRASVDAMRVPAGTDGVWKGSISIGVASRNGAMNGPDDLIKATDNGVYLAKEAGRNCVRHTNVM